jgi:hypothetical protein
MLKKIYLAALMYGFSTFAFSCGVAVPTNDPSFCASFKGVAQCYCSTSLPIGMCGDMNQLVSRLKAVYGSLENACRAQKFTTPVDCMDNWNCYLNGGVDSRNRICSSTGSRCL